MAGSDVRLQRVIAVTTRRGLLGSPVSALSRTDAAAVWWRGRSGFKLDRAALHKEAAIGGNPVALHARKAL